MNIGNYDVMNLSKLEELMKMEPAFRLKQARKAAFFDLVDRNRYPDSRTRAMPVCFHLPANRSSTQNKAQHLQIAGPGAPGSRPERSGHMRRIIEDRGIQIQMAFAIIVGMADPQHPGPVPVGLDMLDIDRMAGRHAAFDIHIQHHN